MWVEDIQICMYILLAKQIPNVNAEGFKQTMLICTERDNKQLHYVDYGTMQNFDSTVAMKI